MRLSNTRLSFAFLWSLLASFVAAQAPVLAGRYSGASLYYTLTISPDLGPWTNVDIALAAIGFDISVSYARDGTAGAPGVNPVFDASSVTLSTDYEPTGGDFIITAIGTGHDGVPEFILEGVVTITTPDAVKKFLVKKATSEFDLTAVISNTAYVESSSSEPAQESSEESSAPESSAPESSAPESSEESSAPESSEESSAPESSAPETSSEETASATEDSSSVAPTDAPAATPFVEGRLTGAGLYWAVHVPASLGPWTSADLALAGENFIITVGYSRVGTVENTDVVIENKQTSITFSSPFNPPAGEELIFTVIAAQSVDASEYTIAGVLAITTPDNKRAVVEFDLSNTIVVDAASSGADSSSDIESSSDVPVSSSEDISSSSEDVVSSSDAPVSSSEDIVSSSEITSAPTVAPTVAPTGNSTSIPTSSDELTTIWGLSTVTETVKGTVTEFVTYCPITTVTKGKETTTREEGKQTVTKVITKGETVTTGGTTLLTTTKHKDETTVLTVTTEVVYSTTHAVSTFAGQGNVVASSFLVGLLPLLMLAL